MDDLFDIDDSRGGPNELKKKRNDQLAIKSEHKVSRVILRGDWTEGRHQELLCEVDGMYIRLSRTNGSDTIQYGADWFHKTKMSVLDEQKLTGKTVRDVKQAFEDTHDAWPSYEQADCQTFAQAIFKKLAGRSVTGVGDDDDFMW